MAKTANTKPKKALPTSPIKTLAGAQLQTRKPSAPIVDEPTSEKIIMETVQQEAV